MAPTYTYREPGIVEIHCHVAYILYTIISILQRLDIKEIIRIKALERKKALERRKATSDSCRKESSRKIIDLQHPYIDENVNLIGCYYPFGSEFNILPLIEHFFLKGFKLALPCIINNEEPLVYREWELGDTLIKNKHSILEPMVSKKILRPNIIFVPGLLFDKLGFRLGYGGGYFDRTIKFMRNRYDIKFIGVCYEFQCIGKVATDIFDEQLDYILNEKEILIIKKDEEI